MNNPALTDKEILGGLAESIRTANAFSDLINDIVETPEKYWRVIEHNADGVRPMPQPAVITLEEYRRQTQPQPKVRGKAWYDREPRRWVKLLSVVQKVARWCVKHSEAIVCVLITLCVVMLILAFAVMMTAQWLG